NQAGLTVEDYLAYLVEDDDTAVVGAFVEGFKKPETFRQAAARARERRKPIVVLKVGRSENARQAMLAHTGSLAGTPEIIEAVLRQSGIIHVSSLNEMIDTLTLLSAARHHTPRAWRVGVLSGLGGECGRAADAADRAGVPLLESTETAMLALRHAREHRRFLDRTDLAHGSLTAPRSNLAAPRASAGFSGTLGNTDAMQLLRDFGIPLAETISAKDAGAAVAAADRLGYPVALKIDSPQIAHKTDVGGIRV